MKKIYSIEKPEEFLKLMDFSDNDIKALLLAKQNDPLHLLFLIIAGKTIAVSPSISGLYYYILDNENDFNIILNTLYDIIHAANFQMIKEIDLMEN